MMTAVGINPRSDLQFQQNSAHKRLGIAHDFADSRGSCQQLVTHFWTPRPFDDCQVRDPHFYRSVPIVGQPVSFCSFCAKICRNLNIALAVWMGTVNLLTIEITHKGKKTCLRKLGSSQQQLLSLLLVAWKLTCSAALSVLQAGLSWVHRSALAKLKVPLLVPLVRFCLITQALRVSLAKTICATLARNIDINRRQDLIPAAFLRLKDPEYV
jgi:hypothetical protein